MSIDKFKIIPTEQNDSVLIETQNEDEVERLLQATGSQELYDRWESMIENLPVKKQIKKLEELHIKRKEALVSDIPGNIEIMRAAPQEFIDMIHEHTRDAIELGRGQNGYVLADPINEKLAYKFLLRMPIGSQNTLAEEATMQGLISEIVDQGDFPLVGVPRLEFFSIDPHLSVIGMERLDAVSIKDILAGIAPLPQETDVSLAFKHLGIFLKKLNDNHDLFHLDIRPGNIMLNNHPDASKNEPLIYLIDMGLSKHRREVRQVTVFENGTFIAKVDKVSDYGSMLGVERQLMDFIKERKS